MDIDDAIDAWPLSCPLCEAELRSSRGTLSCASGHSFDIAREGYTNLLPSQHRISGVAGDVLDMLQARRRFLEAGHYAPLLELLADEAECHLRERAATRPQATGATSVVEVGCGEGYYVGNIATRLGDAFGQDVSCVGADLSKAAARLAARHYPHTTFVVADVNRRIYVHDSSASVLLDVFAPRNPAEFARVIEPGGIALIAIPAAAHLASLRDELGLLGIQEGKEDLVVARFSDEFRLAGRSELEYPLELSPDSARDLVGMGPNSWHRDGGSPVVGEPVCTTASFVVLRLEKVGA